VEVQLLVRETGSRNHSIHILCVNPRSLLISNAQTERRTNIVYIKHGGGFPTVDDAHAATSPIVLGGSCIQVF
jgi:hypothetical protein